MKAILCRLVDAALGAFLICALLPAQRTIIVDRENRPGTTYIDLQQALVNSRSGDTIIVRAVTAFSYIYSCNYNITHSLRLVSEGNLAPVISATGVISAPAGSLVVIDNLNFYDPRWASGFVAYGSHGTVLLSRLTNGVGQASVCDRIIWTDCRMHYGVGSVVYASVATAYVLDCDMEVDYAWEQFWGGAGSVLLRDHSTAWVVNSRLKGGNAGIGPPDFGIIATSGCQALFAGRSDCIGGRMGTIGPQQPGIFGVPSVSPNFPPSFVILDPFVTSAAPRSTSGFELVREIPTVSPGDAIRGQTQTIDLIGPSSSILALFASILTERPPIVTDMGDIWLDPATTVLLGHGAVDANRDLRLSAPIPTQLSRGEVLVYQSASLSPQNLFELSPPGFAVVQ
ncbi:MAG: hypothetical protein U1F36_03145 [Planctomycetota bacterium]